MESMYMPGNSNRNRPPEGANKRDGNLASDIVEWWYRLAAPPEPAIGASLYERERVRHGRVGSLAVLVFIVFLLTILAQQVISDHQPVQIIGILVCLAGAVGGLYLNRRGFVEVSGIFILFLIYIGGTLAISNYPAGLSIDDLSGLYSSIIPEMIALAFFSANSLPIVLCLDMIQVGAIVTYGPHDAAMTHLLRTAPLKILFPVYILQIITTITLYFWARSAEQAIARADKAEERVEFEKREKERQEQALEQKRQLDAGIQQILQTHIAVANGDFNARAPLHQDHVLWQVAVALNNLIGRVQSLSQRERELKQELVKKDERTTEHQRAVKYEASKAIKSETGKVPRARAY